MRGNERKWEIFWEIPDCPPFLTSEPARFFTRQMKEYCGANFSDCILEYRNNTNIWYLDADEWSTSDLVLFERMKEDITWAEKINTISEHYCYPCLLFLDSLIGIDYSRLSNEQLCLAYDQFMSVYIPAHASGHPANVLEMKNQRLSRHLKTYLLNRLLDLNRKENVDELFGLLVEPIKDMSFQSEAISLYSLASRVVANKKAVLILKENQLEEVSKLLEEKSPEIWKDILLHHKNFCWTPYNWEGPANTIENYLGTLKSLVMQGVDVDGELQKLERRGEETKRNQEKLLSELGIDETHHRLLKIASDIMFLKSVRKDCMYKGAWVSEPLYFEIGKRLGLSTHEARFIFMFEMKGALSSAGIDKNLVQSRTKEVVLHQRAQKPDLVLHGDEAFKFIESLKVQAPDRNIKEIKGQIAYPGKVKGVVKYVNTPDMMHKMNEGDILIAYATQPNLLPAMKKAKAFVTDFGGITCHAAIVAREWKVPCVIGTKIATKVLKDGDTVEVDADRGTVKILKRV